MFGFTYGDFKCDECFLLRTHTNTFTYCTSVIPTGCWRFSIHWASDLLVGSGRNSSADSISSCRCVLHDCRKHLSHVEFFQHDT